RQPSYVSSGGRAGPLGLSVGLRRLECDRFLGESESELGFADGIAVIALGLGVLVVSSGLGQILLGLVDERLRVGVRLRLRFLEHVLRLFDHDWTVEA